MRHGTIQPSWGLAKMRGPDFVPVNATLRIGFYQPNHVRYTRTLIPGNPASASYVVLYLCPTATARSRVVLLNVYGVPPPPRPPTMEGEDEVKESKQQAPTKDPKTVTIQQRLRNLKLALFNLPSVAKQRFQAKLMAYFLARNPTMGHDISHQIFDGDGVFLHKQGDRMQRRGLTYMDYETPTPSDVLVNAFRRYLTVAASKTVATKGNGRTDDLARAALPSSVQKKGDNACSALYYQDDLPRSVLLDRYETHTKHCPICRTTLERGRQKERRLKTMQTVLTGAAGASATATLLLLFAAGAAGARGMVSSASAATTTTASLPLVVVVGLVAAGLTAITTGGAVGASKLQRRIHKKNQKFVFEDWVHAENE